MNNPILHRFWTNPQVRETLEAAARRSRAQAIALYFGQIWRALRSYA